jgi:hypothetical protein
MARTEAICGDEVCETDYELTCHLPKGHSGPHQGVARWD